MPRNIFITGLPKSGKTTLLQKLVEEIKKSGTKIGGFITPARLEHGTREGFYVQDIATGRTAQLASLSGGGPKVGKYCVKIKDFESIALPAMSKVGKYDVFVIDEIGRMEMKSKKFTNLLDNVFESKTLVIASISEEYVPVYGFQGETILLTPTNREGVYLELLRKALEAAVPIETVKKADIMAAEMQKTKARAVRKEAVRKIVQKGKKEKKKKMVEKKAKEKPPAKKKEKGEKTTPAAAEERKGFIKKIADLLGF